MCKWCYSLMARPLLATLFTSAEGIGFANVEYGVGCHDWQGIDIDLKRAFEVFDDMQEEENRALSLLNYILALIVAKFGYSVSWGGSAQMAGLLFVFGGATGLMLVIGLITMVVFYATWHPSVSSPN
ncbi:hypothetical protein JHK82_018297 [Glycine max]|nr:hypothetical protein JHK85_018722 [Glycine max]KAG5037482.1 hypothetical protein JHK86_018322 [Glycine max]KAG5142602.1 hypothetical protein JHK82_018297 [Glycine max]